MKRLFFLMALFYLIQLFAGNPALFDLPLQLYLKESLQFPASRLAWFNTIVILPWTIKPLWGLLSDSFPLLGSQVKNWFILCYCAGFTALILLGSLPTYTGILLMVGVTAVSTAIAVSDVLTDKLMVLEGQKRGETGSLQSAQWAALSFGGATMYFMGGWLAEHASLHTAFYLTAGIPFAGLLAVIGLIQESEQQNRVSFRTTLTQLWQTLWSRQYFLVLIFIVALKFHLYPPLVYFLRDTMNFGKQFIGVLEALRFLCGGIGCVIFAMVYKRISRRGLLNWTIGFNVLSTLSFLFIVNRQTASLTFAAVGVTEMLGLLGILELAARACPREIAGTAYALLMSAVNLAERPGRIVGGMLWDRGWSFAILVLIGSALTALCWFLIPLLHLEQQISRRSPGS